MYAKYVPIKIVNKSPNPLPSYANIGDAGMDVRSVEKHTLRPGETLAIPTGLFVEIPPGYEIQVRPRSGLSLKTPLRICNAPGTIDSNYRGEIKIIMQNTSYSDDFTFLSGDRIAQLVLQQVPNIMWDEVDTLESSERGTNGFGSTGVK